MNEKTVKLTATFDENIIHCATGHGTSKKCDHYKDYTFHSWLMGSRERSVCEFWKIGLKYDDTKVLRCDGCISAFNKLTEVKEEIISSRTMIPFKR